MLKPKDKDFSFNKKELTRQALQKNIPSQNQLILRRDDISNYNFYILSALAQKINLYPSPQSNE